MAEITTPFALAGADGRLNPAAVGWTRRPLHSDNLSATGRGWGRTKRWEYWGLMTPDVFIGLTISSLDYAGVHSVFLLDRRTGEQAPLGAVEPLARSAVLPARCGEGTARARAGGLDLEFASGPGGTRIAASGPGFDLTAHVASASGDCLGVVVPWSPRLFQCTVKDLGRALSGTLTWGDRHVTFGEGDGSFAVLDHGRGRWPYSITWNWAAGFGHVEGRAVGVQLGGQWTDGSGQTENGLFVDGRLHKIDEDLTWTYDRSAWSAPCRISGSRVEVSFTPTHVRAERTQLGVVASQIHQCFGTFAGWMVDDSGERVRVDGVTGWAEEARNRW